MGTKFEIDGATGVVSFKQKGTSQFVIESGTSDPIAPTPLIGQIFYRTDLNRFEIYNGSIWSTVSGTPGGSTTQMQYNNAGSFSGTTGLTWNNVAALLSLDSTSSGGITLTAASGNAGNVTLTAATPANGGNITLLGVGADRGVLKTSNFMDFTAASLPAVASAGHGRIIFDSTDNTFKISQHGGPWTAIGSGSGSALQNYSVVATASQTVFNLPFSYVMGSGNLLVFADGLIQAIGATNDYLETSTTQVTFNTGLSAGVVVRFVYGAITTVGNLNTFSVIVGTPQAPYTGGTTLFETPLVYAPGTGSLLVFSNGALQRVGTDYTETSTTSITFLVARTVGGIISFVSGLSSTGSATPGGATGAVQFNNAGALAGDTANLFWDDANNWLGIGTSTPACSLDLRINTASTSVNIINIENDNATGWANLKFNSAGSIVTAGWESSGQWAISGNSGANQLRLIGANMRIDTNNFLINSLQGGGTGTTHFGNFNSGTTNSYSLGNTSNSWTGLTVQNTGITWLPASAPATPGAGNARLYLNSTSNTLLASQNNVEYAPVAVTKATLITNASSPYTVLTTDYTIFSDATSGAITINLPAATGNKGKIYNVKKTDSSANAITINRAGSDLIDGATSFSLPSQYQSITFQSDGGTNWFII